MLRPAENHEKSHETDIYWRFCVSKSVTNHFRLRFHDFRCCVFGFWDTTKTQWQSTRKHDNTAKCEECRNIRTKIIRDKSWKKGNILALKFSSFKRWNVIYSFDVSLPPIVAPWLPSSPCHKNYHHHQTRQWKRYVYLQKVVQWIKPQLKTHKQLSNPQTPSWDQKSKSYKTRPAKLCNLHWQIHRIQQT